MLANRPRGISINKNAANVQANNIQTLSLAGANNVNLKRNLQPELDAPLKGQSSKTPSPPKFKSQLGTTNNVKQSENDVPILIDLKSCEHDSTDLLKQKQPLQPLKPTQPEPKQIQQNRQQAPAQPQPQQQPVVQSVISRIPRLRDIEEEIEDIDKSCSTSRDAIFQVCDVAKDIYSYMYELEEIQSVKEDFLKEQKIFTPKVRQRLVNWCVDLTRKLDLLAETMYMTISIMDRFFETVVVREKGHVQLVALASMLIASKYEEIYPPEMNDLIAYSENAYSRQDIIDMEIKILQKLEFNLGKPIPPAFLRRYSRAAHCDLKMHSIAKFLMEISLSEYECAHWKPSQLAATALFITIHLVYNQNKPQQQQVSTSLSSTRTTRLSTINGLPGTMSSSIGSFGLQRRLVSSSPVLPERWNRTMVHYTRYSRRDLQVHAATLCKILKKVLKTPQVYPAAKNQMQNLSKWPELKSTRVDELIRLGDNLK